MEGDGSTTENNPQLHAVRLTPLFWSVETATIVLRNRVGQAPFRSTRSCDDRCLAKTTSIEGTPWKAASAAEIRMV